MERFPNFGAPQPEQKRSHWDRVRDLLARPAARIAMTTAIAVISGKALYEHVSDSRDDDYEISEADDENPSIVKKKIRAKPRKEHRDHDLDKEAFFIPHKDGKFSRSERVRRTERLPGGELIFHDIGLDFYKVQPGDSISKIRQRLGKYPQYKFVLTQKQKIDSFNIRDVDVQAGMWLPIPTKQSERTVTLDEFVADAEDALEDLHQEGEEYGKVLEAIENRPGMNRKKLLASLFAFAMKESMMGKFELHRYEGHGKHNEFSFSLFHVLMDKNGPGLRARRNLDMTEGQTYHPRNAVKLFFGFLQEKGGANRVARFFPLSKKTVEEFATFYNGSGWRKNNRSYPSLILKHYEAALKKID